MTRPKSNWALRMDAWQAKAAALQTQHCLLTSMMEIKYRHDLDLYVAKCARLSKRFTYQLDQIPTP